MTFTEDELREIIYCMEQMQSDYLGSSADDPDYQVWLTAIHKLDFELNKIAPIEQ